MFAPMNVKLFNSMPSKIVDEFVNISKFPMTEPTEDLNPQEPEDLIANVAGNITKFYVSVKKKCSMQHHVLLYCNRIICFLSSIYHSIKDAYWKILLLIF